MQISAFECKHMFDVTTWDLQCYSHASPTFSGPIDLLLAVSGFHLQMALAAYEKAHCRKASRCSVISQQHVPDYLCASYSFTVLHNETVSVAS